MRQSRAKASREKFQSSPAFVTPMAAVAVKELPEGEEWFYEVKFDGYRALVIKDGNQIQIQSRNHKNLTGMYPSIASAASKLGADRVVIDGEIVALDELGHPVFQALQHRSSHPTHQIAFYAFDVLHIEARDVTGQPIENRRALLPKLLGSQLNCPGRHPR